MTIEHQKIVDANGNPTAAVIPWEVFEQLQIMHGSLETDEEPISADFKAELDRRVENLKNGTTKGIPNDQAMAALHSMIANKK